MSDFLNQLKKYDNKLQETRKESGSISQAALVNSANDSLIVRQLQGKIVLDPRKDPDPYSLHGIPLSVRLQEMGWC